MNTFSRIKTLAAATLLACAAAPALAADLVPIKFSLNSSISADAAPYLLALERGYFKQAGLDVTIDASSGSGEAVTRVASGVYQMGSADFATLVEFAGRQPAVSPKAVLVVYDRAPQAVISLAAANIKKPADLVGKTVGGGTTDGPARLFPALLASAGVSKDAVKWRQVSPQIRDSMLLTKQVDAVVGNDYTTWFNLKPRGLKPEDVNILEYADFGLDVYSNSIIASQAMLKDDPDAVKRFVAAAMKGWQDAIADPQAAAKTLTNRDKLIDGPLEAERLAWVLDHKVKTPHALKYGIGSIDPQRMEKNIATVAESFGLPSVPSVATVYDGRFAPGK
ncbi:ABC transporter substrate-binding protein [Pigmentiphaga soli]|uniref:Thiamine pyrimidine synthase n=1 Tax=Pigmentiphaga soli TaxID=1007095 RepID=A0ABP8HPC7_9BURK